jgi:hypothetical protein
MIIQRCVASAAVRGSSAHVQLNARRCHRLDTCSSTHGQRRLAHASSWSSALAFRILRAKERAGRRYGGPHGHLTMPGGWGGMRPRDEPVSWWKGRTVDPRGTSIQPRGPVLHSFQGSLSGGWVRVKEAAEMVLGEVEPSGANGSDSRLASARYVIGVVDGMPADCMTGVS